MKRTLTWILPFVFLAGVASIFSSQDRERGGRTLRGHAMVRLHLETTTTASNMSPAEYRSAVFALARQLKRPNFKTRMASRAHVTEDSFKIWQVEPLRRNQELRIRLLASDGHVADALIEYVELELGNEFASIHSPLTFTVVEASSGRRQTWWREFLQLGMNRVNWMRGYLH